MKRTLIIIVSLMTVALLLSNCGSQSKEIPVAGDELVKVNIINCLDVVDNKCESIDLLYVNNGEMCVAEYSVGDEIVVSGKTIEGDKATELTNLIISYSQTVDAGKDDYWPDSDEYPAMIDLFGYKVDYIHEGQSCYMNMSGGLAKPKGYDEFISQIKEIITEE